MATFGALTWQLAASALLAITGVLLIAGALSPDNPAPFPAILASGALALAAALFLLRLHFSYMRRQEVE